MKGAAAYNSDPYFQDVPWEIFFDNAGKVVGELFIYSGCEHDRPLKTKKSRGRRKKK